MKKSAVNQESVLQKKQRQPILPYLFLIPVILFLSLFTFYPFLRSIYLTFFVTDKLGNTAAFVGLANYQRVLKNGKLVESILDTLRYASLIGVGTFSLAMVLAYMCVDKVPGSRIYQTMFSMPLAITGAIFGLLITGNTITMPAMMGFVMLVGMVVNNGIVLVDYTNQLMERGMNCYDALTSAGPRRLRPILMTTLTTILGMVPMAVATSEGSEMMQALSIGVIFGLTLSTVVTLVFIPVLYMWMNERRRKANAKRTAKRIARNAKLHAEELARERALKV